MARDLRTVPFLHRDVPEHRPARAHVSPDDGNKRLAIDLLRDAYDGDIDVTLRTRSSPFWGVDVVTQAQLA